MVDRLRVSHEWDKHTIVWLIRGELDDVAILSVIHGGLFPIREHLRIFNHDTLMAVDKDLLWNLIFDFSRNMAVDDQGQLSDAAQKVLGPILEAYNAERGG